MELKDSLTILVATIAALISFGVMCITAMQLYFNRNAVVVGYLLNLREMFAKERRQAIHLKFEQKKFAFSLPTTLERIDVEDYLGLFEVCELMLQNNQMKESYFKALYSYRLGLLFKNEYLKSEILLLEFNYWPNLYKLISRIYGSQWSLFYECLNDYKVLNTNQRFEVVKRINDLLGENKFSNEALSRFFYSINQYRASI